MEDRLPLLREILAGIGPSVVAFSGGVDSTLLLRVAHDVLGADVLAVTAVSPSLAAAEREQTEAIARLIGVRHELVPTHEMLEPGYQANDGRRCYFCKRELFRVLRNLSPGDGRTLLYGAITDDLGDDRPGMTAATEAGARAPLLEAGFDKEMVRRLSRDLGLPTWDKPAMACLASRIPVGTRVTADALRLVEAAEESVRSLGFRQVRVRLRGQGASVELDPAEIPRALEEPVRERILLAVLGAGFLTVAIDPAGYRKGGPGRSGPPDSH
jgi:uncharacterized protein